MTARDPFPNDHPKERCPQCGDALDPVGLGFHISPATNSNASYFYRCPGCAFAYLLMEGRLFGLTATT